MKVLHIVGGKLNNGAVKGAKVLSKLGPAGKAAAVATLAGGAIAAGLASRAKKNKAAKNAAIEKQVDDYVAKRKKPVVPGTRVNEIGAKGGGKPSEGDFKKDFPDKKPEVSTMTKQGKPRTKAQMMAAKRIAAGKSISDVKAENQAAMKAKAKERFAAFKAKRAEKKAAMEQALIPYIKPTMPLLKDKSGNFYTTDGKPFDMEKFKDNYNKKKTKTDKTDVKSSYEYDAYDLVLEYLLSTEQAATIEEANYVMTEMDGETIQGIVEAQKKTLIEKPDDGYIGPKFLGIKNPMNKARRDYQMDYKLKKLSGTGDSPETRDMLNIPRDYEITPEQKKKYGL